MGRRLGDPSDPLLVSVRSGAKFSMPGMMDTVLNLGLNDRSVKGLAAGTDERFAYDSYRRFLAMYGRIVLDLDGASFEHPLEDAKAKAGVTNDAELSAGVLQELCEQYKAVVQDATGKPFPQDPIEQLRGAVEAVFQSWNGARAIAYRVRERISHDLGTAVNVQAMVFGNRDDNSGTGVGFTRNAATGENRAYGDFLINAQGEDVVAGIRNTEDLDDLAKHFPKIHDELLAIFARLERHYADMCDTEFTIEQGKLWMLQTRVGKRTGAAALKMAVDMTKGSGKGAAKWKISREEALTRVTADHLDQVLHPQFAGEGKVLAKGLAASPGAAVGKVYFTADDAEAAAERGEQIILVRNETSPEDVHGMMVAEGHSHRPWRPGQPRRRRRPRLGYPGRGGGRGDQDLGEAVHHRRRDRRRRRRHLHRRLDGRGRARGDGAGRVGTPGRVHDDPEVGRRGAQGQARRARQRRHRRGRRQCPPPRRRGHRAVPHRAHVPRPGPVAGRPADDPRFDARAGGRGTRRAAQGPAGRLHRDPRGDGRAAGHGPPARSAAARVPPVDRGAAHQAGARRALRRGRAVARRGPELVRAQPDARHARRAPRRDQAGAVRDAGAGPARRRRRPAGEGEEPDRRDHDPAHRHPRGARPRRGAGWRTRSPTPPSG